MEKGKMRYGTMTTRETGWKDPAWCYILAVFLLGLTHLGIAGVSAGDWTGPFEGYYLFLGDNPQEASTPWADNINGIAHDDSNWYITQQKMLWKIPVSCDLGTFCPQARNASLTDIPELNDVGYDHFGDLDYYSYSGEGYLIIPIENGPYPGIAFFYASDLSFAAYAYLFYQQGHAPWCAIRHTDGLIYSSAFDDTAFKTYRVDWNQVASAHRGLISLGMLENTQFRNSQGEPILVQNIQGGELTDSDDLLYVISGFIDEHVPYDGLSVFDMPSGTMISHSSNGIQPFNYEFHPGSGLSVNYQEPEGLTIWNLDDRSPDNTGGITGQLHVLMFDHDILGADSMYLKHYTNFITVNSLYGGIGNGRPESPLSTIGSANTLINDFSWGATYFGWDGARIRIIGGTYPEVSGPLYFSKQVQLFAEDGAARIRGHVALMPDAAINVGKEGEMKIN